MKPERRERVVVRRRRWSKDIPRRGELVGEGVLGGVDSGEGVRLEGEIGVVGDVLGDVLGSIEGVGGADVANHDIVGGALRWMWWWKLCMRSIVVACGKCNWRENRYVVFYENTGSAGLVLRDVTRWRRRF